jgi:phage shock protein A
MQQQMVSAKKQVASAIADEKRLRKQLDDELEKANEWEQKAMLAVKSGRDDLATEALQRKAEHDKLAAEYQKQWTLQKNSTDQLKNQLRTLNNKIEEAKRKKNLLIARQKRAKAQKSIQETMSGITDNSAFDTFDRMAEKVDQMEAEATAATELAEDFASDDLSKKFEELDQTAGTDDALAALKRKMGMATEEPVATEIPVRKNAEQQNMDWLSQEFK